MPFGERPPFLLSRLLKRFRALWIPILIAGALLPLSTARAADDLLALVYAENFDGVLAVAANELVADSVDLGRKLDILRVTSMVHMLRHTATADPQEEAGARIAMQTMLRLDPDTDFVPGHRYPPSVHALFAEVREDTFADAPRPPSPTRIAVAPFYCYVHFPNPDFDPEAFAAALPFMVTSQLEALDGLTLLSREHMDVIASELDLATEARLVSAENRVRLGRLLSASAFVYGAVHVNGDDVTLTIRWVATETEGVQTSWQEVLRIREGRDLLDLYHMVVTEQFLPRMLKDLKGLVYLEKSEKKRQEQQRREFADEGAAYLGYVASVARAVRAEATGDLAQAAAHWRTANSLIDADPAPGERAQTLQLAAAYDPPADRADAGMADH